MDSLPVELLRIILGYCDTESVRSLRLLTPTLADIGYDFLIPPTFSALPWRNDVARLRAIAAHPRLRPSIEQLSLNFTNVHADNVRNNSRRHYIVDSDQHTEVLRLLDEFEELRSHVPAFNTHDVADIVEALRPLRNLQHVAVTFRRSPYDNDLLRPALAVPSSCKLDRAEAAKSLVLLLRALQQSVAPVAQTNRQVGCLSGQDSARADGPKLTSFSLDRLPLEMLKQPYDRKVWFQSSNVFAGLTRLDLALDTSNASFPATRYKSITSLGYVLRMAPKLTHLSLAFHNHAERREKFLLSFLELLDENGHGHFGYARENKRFSYANLTDLKLEGISCEERELRVFLLRHASTLERLRLGGRGLARTASEPSIGGISLFNGNFRSLFRSLRGKLPRLQHLHLEGDFECETTLAAAHMIAPTNGAANGAISVNGPGEGGVTTTVDSGANGGPTGSPNSSVESSPSGSPNGGLTGHGGGGNGAMFGRTRYEHYMFHATTDDEWAPIPMQTDQSKRKTSSSAPFEQYLLGVVNEYPEVY